MESTGGELPVFSVKGEDAYGLDLLVGPADDISTADEPSAAIFAGAPVACNMLAFAHADPLLSAHATSSILSTLSREDKIDCEYQIEDEESEELLDQLSDENSPVHVIGVHEPFEEDDGFSLIALFGPVNAIHDFIAVPEAIQEDDPFGQEDGFGLIALFAEENDGWTVVKSRKFGMVRGLHPEFNIPVTVLDPVSEPEVEWEPKYGSLRSTKKWSQVRQGGAVGTATGTAPLVYRLSIPSKAHL